MESVESFTVLDLSSKWRSKTELYNLLTREGKVYLPPKQDSTQSFLRDVMIGKKSYIKWEEVKVIKVPQYKGLTVRDILNFANRNIHIDRFLPKYEYLKDPNREWLCNVINTIIPEKFQKYIELRVEERKKSLINSQNLGISVQPEFMKLFQQSKSISTVKGKSHFLTRMPKPTKDKLVIKRLEEEWKENKEREKDVENQITDLKEKLKKLEEEQIEGQENADKLNKLYQLGIIDSKGEPVNTDMN